jgi:hypothetical protein
MTAVQNPTRHLELAVLALIAIGCDAAEKSATSPNTPVARAPLSAARGRAPVSVRSEKIPGGGGLGISIYDAGSPGARPIVFMHGFTQNF